MSADALEYRHYRCPTATRHGSKDWAIAMTAEGHLAIRFGATGKTARLLDVPPTAFEASSAQAEMTRRESEQLAQGYRFLGRAVVRNGRLEPLAVPHVPARTVHRIEWEITLPIARETLIAELQSAVVRLQSGPLPDPIEFDAQQGVCRVFAPLKWELGYSDAGGLASDNRGGGVIEPEQGLLPLLLIVDLQRTFAGHVSMRDPKGNVISPRFTPDDPILGATQFEYTEVTQLIGRLGLCPAWIQLTDSVETASSAAIWI